MKKYTEHMLTDPMLRRLSAITKGRAHNSGVSLSALERRGLVVDGDTSKYYGQAGRYKATPAGIAALDQARREGW